MNRAKRPECAFDARPDPAQLLVQEYNRDRHVTWHQGRAYLNERYNRVPSNAITPEERKILHQRRLEAAEYRRAWNAASRHSLRLSPTPAVRT